MILFEELAATIVPRIESTRKRGAGYGLRGTSFGVRGASFGVRGAGCGVRSTSYEFRDTGFRVYGIKKDSE